MTLLGRSTPVTAADPGSLAPAVQIHGDKAAQFIPLGVSKSIVVDLPGDIKDVLVADPQIANAVVRTARRAYIIGVAVGQTNVYFFDAEGRQLMAFDIAVTRDLNGIRAAFKRALARLPISPLKASPTASCSPDRFEPRRIRSRPTIWPPGSPVTATRSSTASRSAAATR